MRRRLELDTLNGLSENVHCIKRELTFFLLKLLLYKHISLLFFVNKAAAFVNCFVLIAFVPRIYVTF